MGRLAILLGAHSVKEAYLWLIIMDGWASDLL